MPPLNLNIGLITEKILPMSDIWKFKRWLCALEMGILTSFSPLLLAQDEFTPANVKTSAPATSRYEIVQSPLAVKWTFRLDKYCGQISQLVKTKDDDVAWESMIVVGLPKCPTDSRVRFQLFSSGLAARHTYMLNLETGQSWVLSTVKDKKQGDVMGWLPFAE